ncbi:anthranilate synthase component II [Marinagarivorans algicola]|uniref:anthranilate synthase component II n=1 Tax=Marinagarivorans algicola TaxID=1513270 RepID=UPI0006B68253|nr:aminodeoxychorismate/anthranilate synthase component II [Marinagarivorans algicola]
MQNDQLVVIDNYDSFTYNVVRYLQELGARPRVIRNDQYTLEQLAGCKPRGIIISPGPCTPDDAGISLSVIAYFSQQKTPILGVCLGHQAIGQVFGAKVIRAAHVVHGKASRIHHLGQGMFMGIPSPATVGRYHSLVLESSSLPDCLSVEAWLDEGQSGMNESIPLAQRVIMAIAHKELPVHGVQFHPESILSEHGHTLLDNFLTRYDLKASGHAQIPYHKIS